MSDVIETIRRVVDLDGYSKSRGYIGYFERCQPLSAEELKRAIDIFSNFFGDRVASFCVVSSLYTHGTVADVAEKYEFTQTQQNALGVLVSSGWVDVQEAGVTTGTSHSIESRSLSLRVHELESADSELLKNLFIILLGAGGVRGHCFLVSEYLQLVVYPHDDTGFGVIAFGERGTKLGIEFLKHAEGAGAKSALAPTR